MPTLLFDGIAYGMLLFVLALGLAVTMGLMNFINLAHGAFAMAGGYIVVVGMQRQDHQDALITRERVWLRQDGGRVGRYGDIKRLIRSIASTIDRANHDGMLPHLRGRR